MSRADPPFGPDSPAAGRRVLLGVLDWGLGHAARSCVLAQRYRDNGWSVLLASAGPAGRLLRAEFPELPYYELPAYAVRYPGPNMYRNLAAQLPRLLATAWREHRWLARFCRRERVDLVLSDNRFGLYHARVRSVLLTHQTEPILHPAVAAGAMPLYRAALRRFAAIWIPDDAGPDRLSGRLSAAGNYAAIRYIGPLSRFAAYAEHPPGPGWDTVTLLSGPEPQRTRLERELLPQLLGRPGRNLLIRGLPAADPAELPTTAALSVVPALYGSELARALAAARLVICRSGYSTLMDLRALNRPALLIPTPGQTEQAYLARRAAAQGWGKVQQQGRIRLDLLTG